MKIGFALIPQDSVVEQIIDFEQRFHDSGNFSHALGIKHNLPHITLFQGEMNENFDYVTMANSLSNFLVEKRLIPLVSFSKIVYVEKGWYFLMCDNSDFLLSMHDFVLKHVEPYIVLPPDRMERDIECLTENQYKAILRYNYRYAAEAFCPHITIGRSAQEDVLLLKKMNEAFSEMFKSSIISKITVYKMGQNGTHENTLYEIKI